MGGGWGRFGESLGGVSDQGLPSRPLLPTPGAPKPPGCSGRAGAGCPLGSERLLAWVQTGGKYPVTQQNGGSRSNHRAVRTSCPSGPQRDAPGKSPVSGRLTDKPGELGAFLGLGKREGACACTHTRSHVSTQAHPGQWRLLWPQAGQACGAWRHPGHMLLGPQPRLSCPRVAMQPPDPDPGHGTSPITWGCHSRSDSRWDLISEFET